RSRPPPPHTPRGPPRPARAPRHDREPAGALPCRPQARLARLRVVIVFWASRHGKPLLSGPFGRARPGAPSGRIPRKVEGMLSSSAKFPRQAARDGSRRVLARDARVRTTAPPIAPAGARPTTPPATTTPTDAL